MNAVVKPKAEMSVDRSLDVVSIKSASLSAMARWAENRFADVCRGVPAGDDNWRHIEVFAVAIDESASVHIQEHFYRVEERRVRPALAIRINEEGASVFGWWNFKTDYSQHEDAVLGVFNGTRLLFEHVMAPRPKGVKASRHYDALLTRLRAAGASKKHL
jgi:hypothetical protein